MCVRDTVLKCVVSDVRVVERQLGLANAHSPVLTFSLLFSILLCLSSLSEELLSDSVCDVLFHFPGGLLVFYSSLT